MPGASAWSVNVPLDDLKALYGLKDDLDRITAENAQLRREVEGLRRVQSEFMEKMGDIRRSINSLIQHSK